MANEHSQIVPSMQPTSTVADFKFWCQKVLPLVYDDSLSYYEVLNKMVVYLNQVIDNINADTANVAELEDDFLLLQTYVNNFFDDIDQLATYAERAEAAQTAAAASAISAASSASNAATSASNSAGSASSAATSALSALDAKDAAVAAKTAAETALASAQSAATMVESLPPDNPRTVLHPGPFVSNQFLIHWIHSLVTFSTSKVYSLFISVYLFCIRGFG